MPSIGTDSLVYLWRVYKLILMMRAASVREEPAPLSINYNLIARYSRRVIDKNQCCEDVTKRHAGIWACRSRIIRLRVSAHPLVTVGPRQIETVEDNRPTATTSRTIAAPARIPPQAPIWPESGDRSRVARLRVPARMYPCHRRCRLRARGPWRSPQPQPSLRTLRRAFLRQRQSSPVSADDGSWRRCSLVRSARLRRSLQAWRRCGPACDRSRRCTAQRD